MEGEGDGEKDSGEISPDIYTRPAGGDGNEDEKDEKKGDDDSTNNVEVKQKGDDANLDVEAMKGGGDANIAVVNADTNYKGEWELFTQNSGVSAMHIILLPKIDRS